MQDQFEAQLKAIFEGVAQYRNVVEQIKKQARQDPENPAALADGSVKGSQL